MKKNGFNLEQMFGSKTRARLMGIFLKDPEQAFYVRELTRRIDAQLNSVRRELQNLMEMNFIFEMKTEGAKSKALADRKKFYKVNKDFILFHDLKSLFQKIQILLKQNLVQEIDEKGAIDYFAFTGRFVDLPDIPTDILIVGNIKQIALQKLVSKFDKEVPYEINYTLMPKEEFLDRKQVSDRFLTAILTSDKIVMVDRIH